MENDRCVHEMRFETGKQRTLVASEMLFCVSLESVLIMSEEKGLEAPRFSTPVQFRGWNCGETFQQMSRCFVFLVLQNLVLR